jgi:hypothetical protein
MSPLFAFRFEIARANSTQDVLMIFAATVAFDAEAFATVVESEIEANLVPDEVLVVVRGPSFAAAKNALRMESTHQATLARLRDRSTVTLVAYDHHGRECDRAHIAGPEPSYPIRFDDFRRRGTSAIFAARHGFVESTATYHFETPSGRHTERFIRLSNILVRGAEIAFIGFCTLPYVPEGATIAYLDTPSLYAVVAAINEQRSSFPNVALILADNFSSYAGLKDYQFERLDEAFVLISASSTGSLASSLTTERGFEPARITHLLFLGKDKSGSNIVCNLRRGERDNPEGVPDPPAVESAETCRMCAGGSVAIRLQGDQFEFAGPQQDSLLVNKNDAPAGLRSLIERTAGRGLFAVGLGRNTGPQPRHYEVSPTALLANPDFTRRLDYALRRSIPSSVRHVVALDIQSKPFAEIVANQATGPVQIVDRDQLDSIPDSTRSAVVIAAAVVESGRSLLDISRDLRSIAPEAPLLYLVGFSKTTGEPRREALERNLVETLNPYPYQFIEIERMVLPPSSEQNAWTEELKLLIDPDVSARAPAPLRAAIQARVDRLRRWSEAITNGLFLTNAPGGTLVLQPGFVFWPPAATAGSYSQADVFFTIASVLQQLRANAQKAGKSSAIKSNWFQQTILAPGNFGRYNDDLIQASILRAAYPFEMNYADASSDSREFGRLIRRIVEASHTARGGAAAEFLLAIATRRITLCPTDSNAILSAKVEGSPMVALLQDVCRARLDQ